MKRMNILLAVVFLLIAGCYQIITEPQHPWESESHIPAHITAVADSVLISFLGQYQFTDYVYLDLVESWYREPAEYCADNPDSCRSAGDKGFYNLVYKYTSDISPRISAVIQFQTDTLGNILGGLQTVPNCAYESVDCSQLLPLHEILYVAHEAGLKPGIDDWEIAFGWSEDSGTYVWRIRATYQRTTEQWYSASGELFIIDVFSGAVVQKFGWTAIS
ncbi:MAG: hypothetical protein GF372_00165 [Candidatus Marinimicrobia bacterium]|nr:hypothetical protein [Candidatus Neomarinimicrobiota bacterium]